jgi:hypothetical protein
MITCMLAASGGFPKDGNRIRELFEWGEYDSLAVALGGYFSAHHDTVDSDTTCLYLSYLGVAYFAKGDIAEAERQFRRSLDCQPALVLDKKYVNPEMINLFTSVKNDREQELAYSTQEESIKEATVIQHYEQESNKSREGELRSSFWKHSLIAASLGASAVALGSLAAYEFSIHKNDAGIRFSVPSLLCGSLCIVITVKSISLRRMMAKQSDADKEHTVEVSKQ